MSFRYPVTSSGLKSVSAQISTISSLLSGIDMLGPTTGSAVLTVYDSENSTTSGKTILAEMQVDAGMPSCNHEYVNLVIANRGLYVALTDASNTATYIIRYGLG